MTTWSWSGWTEIPGGGQSSEGPAATFYSGKLYVFVHGYYQNNIADNRIYCNVFDGKNWSGWTEVKGNGQGYGSPAVAAGGDGKLYVVVRGVEDGIYYNVFDGKYWSGWAEVAGNGRTSAPPAVANFFGKLYVVVRGVGDRIYYNVLDGKYWSGWAEVAGNGRTNDAPAVVSYNGKLYVLVAGVGPGPTQMYYNVFDGKYWSGWAEVGGNGRCIGPIAATVIDGKLRVVIVGVQFGIYYNFMDANGNWSSWTEVGGNGKADYAPPGVAVTDDGSSLYIFVAGVGARIYCNQETLVASSTSTPVTTGGPTGHPTGSSPISSAVVGSEMQLSTVTGFGNLRVYGSGFAGGEEIMISIESKSSVASSGTSASTTATPAGGFNVIVAVPCPLGVITTHSPSARGVTSGKSATGSGASC